MPLRRHPLSPDSRACRLQNLLVPRLSAHLIERHSQRNLSQRIDSDHRASWRVRQRRRERQPCPQTVLRQMRKPPVCRLDWSSWPYRGPRWNARRSIVNQPGSQYLEFKCTYLGLPESSAAERREAAKTSSASAKCGLTRRSRRGPTAGHQARSGGTRYIFTSPGLASHRQPRLTSNVRPHNNHRP